MRLAVRGAVCRRDRSAASLDFLRQRVDGAVYLTGIADATVGTPRRGIPDCRVYRDFRSDLRCLGVDAHLAQELAQAVLADFRAVDIEQYGKRAAAFYVLYSFPSDGDCKPFCNSFVEHLCIYIDFVVSYLGVYLRCIDPAVS